MSFGCLDTSWFPSLTIIVVIRKWQLRNIIGTLVERKSAIWERNNKLIMYKIIFLSPSQATGFTSWHKLPTFWCVPTIGFFTEACKHLFITKCFITMTCEPSSPQASCVNVKNGLRTWSFNLKLDSKKIKLAYENFRKWKIHFLINQCQFTNPVWFFSTRKRNKP